jgi:predicted GTPase
MASLSFGKKSPQSPSQIQHCNVLVIGNTGTGKSTLIKALFNSSEMEIEDVTKNISDKPFIKENVPVAAYDTPGLEKDEKQRNKVKRDITKFIKQQNQKEPNEQIHAIWYCVNSQVTKENQIEREWIDSLAKELPVLAVITRAYGAEENWLKPYLEGISSIQCVVSIVAQEEKVRPTLVEPYGLDRLLSVTDNLRKEIAKKAISNAVNAKASQAFPRCLEGCTQVFSVQAVPMVTAHLVPAPLMKPATAGLQVLMLKNISDTFGCQINKNELNQLKGFAVAITEGFEFLLEGGLKNLLSTNPNNISIGQLECCLSENK